MQEDIMKNIFSKVSLKAFVSLLACAAFTVSCNLDTIPEDRIIPERYFSNAASLEEWLNNCYNMFESYGVCYLDCDDMVSLSPTDWFKRALDPSTESWSWTQLRRINYFLANSHYCNDENAVKVYNAEARFFRAYFYIEMVKKYGDIMWYDTVIGSTDNDKLYKARDPRMFVADRIIEDLEAAVDGLEDVQLNANHTNVTKWTALALLARYSLFEGSFVKYHEMDDEPERVSADRCSDYYFQVCYDACNELILENKFSLYRGGVNSYRELFFSGNCNEIILARYFGGGITQRISNNVKTKSAGLTQRFVNHYLMKDGSRISDEYLDADFFKVFENRDPRMSMTVWGTGVKDYVGTSLDVTNDPFNLSVSTGYFPLKYIDGININDSESPIILMRYSEILLDYAEAACELGVVSNAILDQTVNAIRARGGVTASAKVTTSVTPDPLLKKYYPHIVEVNTAYGVNTAVLLEIIRERTVELVMEGRRQWDIIRWGEGKSVDNTKNPFYGVYIPGPGVYDFRGDNLYLVDIYTDTPSSDANIKKRFKIGTDITLSEGTKGHIIAFPKNKFVFDEDTDYLWPIPAKERALVGAALTQNPGWDDGLSF